MQKNLSPYAPDIGADARRRDAGRQAGRPLPMCDDRETLLWFANQRAVEYHPTLFRGPPPSPDPPGGRPRPTAGSRPSLGRSAAAVLVRQALTDAGMAGR